MTKQNPKTITEEKDVIINSIASILLKTPQNIDAKSELNSTTKFTKKLDKVCDELASDKE